MNSLTLSNIQWLMAVAFCSLSLAPKATAQVGKSCSAQLSCSGSNQKCFDNLCKCQPGYIACGTGCVDIVTDSAHCGSCSNACSSPQSCHQGVCSGFLPPFIGPIVHAPVDVSTAGTNCSKWESHPSRSLNDGTVFQANNGGDADTSWSTNVTTWSNPAPIPTSPPVALTDPKLDATGDVWTASSGYSGLEYVAARTISVTGPYASASGIAATTAAHLRNGIWDFPDTWAIPADEAGDGVTIAADEGGSGLWLVASSGNRIYDSKLNIIWDTTTGPDTHQKLKKTIGPRSLLYYFPDCKSGNPGSLNCQRYSSFPIPSTYGGSGEQVDFVDLLADLGKSPQSHSTVIVNPCTHHALVSFITNDGSVMVRAVAPSGAIAQTWTLANVGQVKGNSGCINSAGTLSTDVSCGGNTLVCPDPATVSPPAAGTPSGLTCNRTVPRVQLDIAGFNTNGKGRVAADAPGAKPMCVLYAGWDEEFTATIQLSNGKSGTGRRFRSSLASLDVTTEASTQPTIITNAPGTTGNQTWNSTPVASRFGSGIGWFFFYGTGDSKSVSLNGYFGDALNTLKGATVSPVLRNQQTGDNLSQLLGGLPGGRLFATWPELTNSCRNIRGAVVTP